jgi:hypothetical protein
VRALTAGEIRSSFVNCSKGEATRLVPPPLDQIPWDDLDFLGWQDPHGSPRAYLIVERAGELVGLVLRQTSPSAPGSRRSTMCQWCVTPHSGSGVALSVARKTGPAGKKGDSTGVYTCRDLACSLYIRHKRAPSVPRLRETISVEASIARCRGNVDDFVARVLAG